MRHQKTIETKPYQGQLIKNYAANDFSDFLLASLNALIACFLTSEQVKPNCIHNDAIA